MLRPEAVHLGEAQAYATGVVSRVVYLGSVVEYDLIVQETNLHAVVSSPIEKGIRSVGDEVGVYFAPQVVHVIPA